MLDREEKAHHVRVQVYIPVRKVSPNGEPGPVLAVSAADPVQPHLVGSPVVAEGLLGAMRMVYSVERNCKTTENSFHKHYNTRTTIYFSNTVITQKDQNSSLNT